MLVIFLPLAQLLRQIMSFDAASSQENSRNSL